MSDYPSMSHVQHITFEGNDCVVMSPEEYGAALADLEAKDYELSALRAELTEARRQLKEASEQEPVAWSVRDRTGRFVTEQKKRADEYERLGRTIVQLYAAPVPQPAVPEAVASDADWNHVPVGRVIGDPVWAGQLWRSQIQGTKKLRHGDLVYIRPVAILSATDSKVKK